MIDDQTDNLNNTTEQHKTIQNLFIADISIGITEKGWLSKHLVMTYYNDGIPKKFVVVIYII